LNSGGDVAQSFYGGVLGQAQSLVTGFVGAYESTVVSAALAADQAETSAATAAVGAVATATRQSLAAMGVAVKDQEQAEAEAEHSAGGTITDALTGFVDAELAAEGTLAHAQINASTSFSGTVMATAFTTLVGDWQDQDALFGSQVGASVGYTQSVVDASSRYLQAVNGIDDQALAAADARKEAQLKSVLDAGVGLAMAGASAWVADELQGMQTSLTQMLSADANTLGQYNPDGMWSVVGGPMMMMMTDIATPTPPENLTPPPGATPDQIEAIQAANTILNNAAATASGLRNYGVQTAGMIMMMGGAQSYEQSAWQMVDLEGGKVGQAANNQFALMLAKDQAAVVANPPAPPPAPPSPPKNDDAVKDGDLTAGFVYIDPNGIAWVKRLLTDPQTPNTQVWYFRTLNEVKANEGQGWTNIQWNAFFASGDRGAPVTERVFSQYNGGPLDPVSWTGLDWSVIGKHVTDRGRWADASLGVFNGFRRWVSYPLSRPLAWAAGDNTPFIPIGPAYGHNDNYSAGDITAGWGYAGWNFYMMASGVRDIWKGAAGIWNTLTWVPRGIPKAALSLAGGGSATAAEILIPSLAPTAAMIHSIALGLGLAGGAEINFVLSQGTPSGGNVAPNNLPPLKPIHGLDQKVLEFWDKKSTAEIIESLKPGNPESLKAFTDGRILNGHHRLDILKKRGVNINCLPREIRDPMAALGLPPGID
jgi:hypothetical protein